VRVPLGILPPGTQPPATFDGAVIHGKLQSEDRKKLETLVGRVPYLSGKVKSVVTSWPEFVVAAKVERDNRLIFCAKTEDGEWHITGIIIFTD
jgi:hypothetical protein